MSPHEVMAARTRALEEAVYGLLDVCDDYRKALEELLATEQALPAPRDQLVHRLKQLSARISSITTIVEDEVVTEMLPIMDRLFAIERAERGVDI